MKMFLGILVLGFLTCNISFADSLRVVDGETIVLNGEKIRFIGIDTPELKQTCMQGDQEIGIYRSFTHRRPGPDPTQVAYFDEIRFAKSCKKLKIKDLGYSCKEIESQSLK